MSETRVSCWIDAPPATVYQALVTTEAVQVWMVPTGMRSTVHEFDPRVGGSFRISLTYDDPSAVGKTRDQTDSYHGRFVELEPGRRFVEAVEFETDDPVMQGEMRISILLQPEAHGTLLHALHENLPPGLRAELNEVGWRASLQKLKKLMEEGEEAVDGR